MPSSNKVIQLKGARSTIQRAFNISYGESENSNEALKQKIINDLKRARYHHTITNSHLSTILKNFDNDNEIDKLKNYTQGDFDTRNIAAGNLISVFHASIDLPNDDWNTFNSTVIDNQFSLLYQQNSNQFCGINLSVLPDNSWIMTHVINCFDPDPQVTVWMSDDYFFLPLIQKDSEATPEQLDNPQESLKTLIDNTEIESACCEALLGESVSLDKLKDLKINRWASPNGRST